MLSEEEKRNIANFVGLGAVRYALIDVDPGKPVVFTWERVLNFETNSAPYVQYTHARACSILRKAAREPENADYGLLAERLEKELILNLANFPDMFIEATEYLKPNMIADYANALADKFNTFYNAYPVIKADSRTAKRRTNRTNKSHPNRHAKCTQPHRRNCARKNVAAPASFLECTKKQVKGLLNHPFNSSF